MKGRINDLRVVIQGLPFLVEVYVLVLAGCDMIFRANWLHNVGTIL